MKTFTGLAFAVMAATATSCFLGAEARGTRTSSS